MIPTFINHYLEIKLRENVKPEFNKLFNYLKENETKDLALFLGSDADNISV